ncbi:MAG TPA: penicillin-binding transpeptidase domain-containing protein, partial [Blastocatellia bacterium]|nr:penicillin-binding transpeptidase domain-containing protein [Blastocatellia bacterium]
MKFPFIATLIVLFGLGWMVLSLIHSALRSRSGGAVLDSAESGLPEDFGPRLTSHRLRYVRWAFALLVLIALGFHCYWGLFAAGPIDVNESFEGLKDRRDQRNRREVESTLRGWIYDRHHDARQTLAKYRYLNGQIVRDYPLGPAAAHLVGYGTLLRGDAWLERAVVSQPLPKVEQSWWEKVFSFNDHSLRPPVGPDLVLSLDFNLQKEAFAQLKDKRGAVVMLNPQTGEILAMASSPSYDPEYIEIKERWAELQNDVRNQPLLNRALSEYYLPGSTLKTMTAAAAIESRLDNLTFTCRSEGWTPPGANRPIRDDEEENHGAINLTEAYAHSCNQYFAQLGVEVERKRMADAATRFGLVVFEKAAESIGSGRRYDLWNTENRVLSSVLAPLNSTFVSGPGVTRYDLALESIGQGYVQLTPLQMAMVAAAAANREGMVMRPTMELGRPPKALSQAVSPQTAERLRQLMGAVVQRGTASRGLGAMLRGKLTAGGKTGTAQRQVNAIDPKTNRPIMYRDERGRERVKKEFRIDSWFIGFAPLENPLIAFAVVVEGGGYGAKTAAPIAGNLLLKAAELKLLDSPPPP